jgi:DNA polymerase I-like protein with 3'-5' exonuclease and polymerase domains
MDAESSFDAPTSSLDSSSSSSSTPLDSVLNPLPAARLVLQVHDELLFEVRTDLMDRVLPLICAAMLDISFDGAGLSVPLQLQVSSGKSWGSMVKIKQASQ